MSFPTVATVFFGTEDLEIMDSGALEIGTPLQITIQGPAPAWPLAAYGATHRMTVQKTSLPSLTHFGGIPISEPLLAPAKDAVVDTSSIASSILIVLPIASRIGELVSVTAIYLGTFTLNGKPSKSRHFYKAFDELDTGLQVRVAWGSQGHQMQKTFGFNDKDWTIHRPLTDAIANTFMAVSTQARALRNTFQTIVMADDEILDKGPSAETLHEYFTICIPQLITQTFGGISTSGTSVTYETRDTVPMCLHAVKMLHRLRTGKPIWGQGELRSVDDDVEVSVPVSTVVESIRRHDLACLAIWESVFVAEDLLSSDHIATILRYFQDGTF